MEGIVEFVISIAVEIREKGLVEPAVVEVHFDVFTGGKTEEIIGKKKHSIVVA